MLAEIGIVTIGLGLLSSVVAVLFALANAFTKEKRWGITARNLLIFTFVLLTVACLVLVWAQWSGDYSISYVKNVSSNVQPDTLKITALWGSQQGSLLFYGWMLSLFLVLALVLNWKSHNDLMGWVMVFAGGTLAFFLVLSVFFENPFQRTWMGDPTDPEGEVITQTLQPEGHQVAYPWRASYCSLNGQALVDCEKSEVEIRRDFNLPATMDIEIVRRSDFPFYGTSATERPHPVDEMGRELIPDHPLITWEHDGAGLNPLLRHPGMVIHPPMLYLGFTGFILPFAFAMAAMIIGQGDASWMQAVRRWSLIAWMFLSIGLVLGGRWAYDVLGWGGYWGWDPVENSALLPWLTGTAFLHSVMIQEKRGMLKGWNMSMIIATYLLVLLGTVATRTGLLSSVHTFAESPLAIPMGGFLGGTMLFSLGVFMWRGNQGYFKGDHEIDSLFSRESMFMLNNWVFFALTIVVFWGTWAEKITDFMVGLGMRDTIINLGPEYYEVPVSILFLIIYILMGVAPLVAWRRASAERLGRALTIPIALTAILMVALLITGMKLSAIAGFSIITFAGIATLLEIYKGVSARHRAHKEPWGYAFYRLIQRNHRRYGGYIIHLGVVIIGIGVVGSTLFQDVTQQTMDPGDSVEHAGYVMQFDEIQENGVNNPVIATADDNRVMHIAEVSVWKDGEQVTILRPRRDIFPNATNTMLIAGTHSTLEGDFYVRINEINGDRVTFAIYYNPLIGLVWWGGILMILGTVVSVYPQPETSHVRFARRRMVTAPAPAGD